MSKRCLLHAAAGDLPPNDSAVKSDLQSADCHWYDVAEYLTDSMTAATTLKACAKGTYHPLSHG